MSESDPTSSPAAGNWPVVRRLLALSWRYRGGCLNVLGLQLVLLVLGLSSLGLTGVGIDYIRYQALPGSLPPRWPFGWEPPHAWTPLRVVGVIAGAILLLATVRSFLTYFYQVALNRLLQMQIVVDLRTAVYEKLQRLSFRFFDANATGAIINRVTGDVQQTRSFVDGVVMQTIIMILSLATYLVYMLNIHVGLTLTCLATTPVLWVASVAFSRQVRPEYLRNRQLVDHMVEVLAEMIQGIAIIKGFAREPEATAKFRSANTAVRVQQQKIFWQVSVFTPGIGFLTQVNIAVLLLYGGWLFLHDQITLGTGLVVFGGLLQQFSGQISNLANIANTAQQSLTGARRVFDVLDAPVEIQSPPVPSLLPRLRGAVRLEHVSFEYRPGEAVLQDISFEVAAGQCVAIVGATGMGKSTLLSLIPRFYDPTRGRVLVDGTDIRQLDLDRLRRSIGVVFQEGFLFSNTIAANIAFGHPEASAEQIERAARVAAAHEFITGLPQGYATTLREGGADLSGGQRQRLAIARAILLDPAILLLDDPTAAVDAQTEQEIMVAVESAMRGRTTFIVAHRLSTLRRADVILVLEGGRIVQRGTHAELLRQPGPYRQVAQLQFAPGSVA